MNNVISLGIGKENKPFSWSYSKIKNFDSCPKKHQAVDLLKLFKEEESDVLRWGNEVHDGLAKRVRDGTPLPFTMKHLEPVAAQVLSVPGRRLVEQQLAINKDFQPCAWFARDAWFRIIADVIVLNPPVAFAVDYKTGKILHDSQQLALLAACVFLHHPDINAVRTEFWWIREDEITKENFRRKDMTSIWRGIWPKYLELKNASETGNYPAKQSGLCKDYCPVVTCSYNGKYIPPNGDNNDRNNSGRFSQA